MIITQFLFKVEFMESTDCVLNFVQSCSAGKLVADMSRPARYGGAGASTELRRARLLGPRRRYLHFKTLHH